MHPAAAADVVQIRRQPGQSAESRGLQPGGSRSDRAGHRLFDNGAEIGKSKAVLRGQRNEVAKLNASGNGNPFVRPVDGYRRVHPRERDRKGAVACRDGGTGMAVTDDLDARVLHVPRSDQCR